MSERQGALIHHESSLPNRVLYTIGHSNHALEAFLELLRTREIRLISDVRSSPYARYSTQFNKETLESHLLAEGFLYQFMGHVLGGRPQDPRFYDSEGYVLYDRIAASSAFQQGLMQLLEQAVQLRTAVLCGEENPRECHRRLLLGRAAGERGYEVLHLRGDGRVQSEERLAEEERFQRTRGQLSLFDMDGGEKPWRSTRSVSRENRPGYSSRSFEGPEFGG